MKVFKKTLPVLMAAMLLVPSFAVNAAELDPAKPDTKTEADTGGQDDIKPTVDEGTTTPDTSGDTNPDTSGSSGDTTPTPAPSHTGKSWNVGKNDPTEVVATYSNGVLTFTNEYTYDPDSGAEELPNPGLMQDNACSEIASYLSSNEITGVRVVIGSGVQTVGANALSGSNSIAEVDVASSDFKEFKQGAFSNCANLTKVNVPRGAIGASAFQGSPVSNLSLGTDVTSIGDSAFQGSKVTELMLPASLKTIGASAFADGAVAKIMGGASVTSVGNGAFSGAKSITLSNDASEALKNYDWSGAGYSDIMLGDVKQVVVTFNVNGGTTIAPKTMNAGEKLTPPTPVYAGMTFDGWFTDSGCTLAFANETVVENNITLYAKWHGDTVTLTMNPNNGTASTTQTVKYGEKPVKPSDPAASGDKVFGGWFTDSACTKAFSFDTVMTSDLTIYAKWGDATYYTVKFDTDGGSAIDNQSVKSGSQATKPADPTKTDYTFDGWYKDKKFKDKWDFEKEKVTGDTTIYGRFLSNKVTVKFDTRGGSAINSVVVDRNSKLTNPGTPTKDNAEFLGWYKDEGLNTEFNIDTENVTDNMTLYAKWNQTAFTVKFESNGGTSVEPVTANPNSLIAKPADPTKAGYYLVGWCKDSDLKNQWNFDSDKVTADVTLYALWAVGDPNTVNNGNQPGVTNTGAKVPQTGDVSNPLFHLFAGISSFAGAGGVGGLLYTKKKRRLF